MKRRVVLVLLVAFALGGCRDSNSPSASSEDDRPVTRAEAERVLADIVEVALAEGAAALCDEDRGLTSVAEICEAALTDVGEDSTPKERPTIVSFKPGDKEEFTPRYAELELQGVDGRGRPYHQDLYITREDGRVVARSPIWWSRFSGVADEEACTRTEDSVKCSDTPAR